MGVRGAVTLVLKKNLFSGSFLIFLLSVVLLKTLQAYRHEFEQRVLEAHNYYRGMHGAPPLTLNPRMSQMATQWAQYLSATNSIFHSHKAGLGENIFFSSGASLGGSDVVTSWYREIMYYNWNYPVFSYTTGHFTQLVWKASTYLGVGIARRGNAIYVVCNYYPAGNIPNGFWQNVSPQKGVTSVKDNFIQVITYY